MSRRARCGGLVEAHRTRFDLFDCGPHEHTKERPIPWASFASCRCRYLARVFAARKLAEADRCRRKVRELSVCLEIWIRTGGVCRRCTAIRQKTHASRVSLLASRRQSRPLQCWQPYPASIANHHSTIMPRRRRGQNALDAPNDARNARRSGSVLGGKSPAKRA